MRVRWFDERMSIAPDQHGDHKEPPQHTDNVNQASGNRTPDAAWPPADCQPLRGPQTVPAGCFLVSLTIRSIGGRQQHNTLTCLCTRLAFCPLGYWASTPLANAARFWLSLSLAGEASVSLLESSWVRRADSFPKLVRYPRATI